MGRLSTGCSTIELRRKLSYYKRTGCRIASILYVYIQLLNTARYCLCENKFCEPFKFSKIELKNHKQELIDLINIPEESVLGENRWRGQKQEQ